MAVSVTAGWLVIQGRGKVWIRAIIIVGLIGSTVGLIERVERYRGTPRVSETPNEILVHGFVLDEDSKRIYLYCGRKPPLSLIVPYSREMHEALKQGQQQFQGKPFLLAKEGEPGEGEEGNGRPGDGENGGPGDGDLSLESEAIGWVVKVPPALLPEK